MASLSVGNRNAKGDDAMTVDQRCQPRPEPVRQHTPTPKLVMGEIVCMGPGDEDAIPYDEAVIFIEGDEDSEIRINCPGALRLAPVIVEAANNHDRLTERCEAYKGQVKAGSDEIASLKARIQELEDLGRFLLARLDEFDPGDDDPATEYYGHVAPAQERFRAALESKPAGETVA